MEAIAVDCLPVLGSSEHILWLPEDGGQYLLGPAATRMVISVEGTGMPEINHITQRGPMQHGSTLLDYRLQPRLMQFVVHHRYGSRQSYWAGRATLLDTLRPNRGLSGVLRFVLADGSLRDIVATIQEGPNFAPRDPRSWTEHSFREVLRFIAHNPVFYDPQAYDVLFIQTGGFTFPITFPITFTAFGYVATVVYGGNWDEYPLVTVTGPLTSMVLYNHTTDEEISLTYTLAVGQSAIFDLSNYAHKKVTREDGTTNIIGSASGDIATFHLQPGANNLEVTAVGSGAATSVTVQWLNRYIGI
jgi:hypothetical protein